MTVPRPHPLRRGFFVGASRRLLVVPHAEASKLIATNLHALPHPEHGEIRLMGFRPFVLSQQPKDVQEKVSGHADAIGEATVHLLEQNGKTIIDTAELAQLRAVAAAQEPGPKVARGFCAHCGTEVIHLAVDTDMNARLHRVALQTMGSTHNCWT